MSRPTLDVVAAVIVHDGRVLACRRRTGLTAAGRWEFPGGKIEPGEDPAEALVREIGEELGVEVRVGRMLRADTTPVGGRGIRLSCFAATLAGPAPVASTDHDRLEWLLPRDLAGLPWADPDLPMVRKLSGGTLAE